MIQIGANTVVFGGETIRTAMQHLKWAGYDAVEISALQGWGVFGDPLGEHLHLDRWREDAREIRALSEEFELPITATEIGPLDEDRALKALEAATEIGIPIVNIGPSGKSDRPEDLTKCIERMAKLAPCSARRPESDGTRSSMMQVTSMVHLMSRECAPL